MSNYFYDGIIPNYVSGTNSIKVDPTPTSSTITLTDGTTTNTLTQSDWTGTIKTANTTANLTHYLNFSDSSGTGQGNPQKNASLSCNPSTGLITATTFDGDLTGNATTSTTSTNIITANDNVNATRYLVYVSGAGTAGPRIDITTGPLTYNPSTGTVAAAIFNGSLVGNASTATLATSVNVTNDNTNTTQYLMFANGTGTQNPLIDITTGPLTYNPNTGILTSTTFNGQLTGKSDSTNTITLTSDNTTGTYFIPFAKTVSGSSSLFVDDVTGPLTYNPNTGAMSVGSITTTGGISALTLAGELLTSSGVSPSATFAGTTLTYNCNSVTLRCGTIIFTGSANTVTTLSLTTPRNNGIYYIGIRNNGTAGTSFLTGLGANILTKYSTTVVVPAGTSALMSINVLTINAVQTSVVGIDLLT